VTFWDMFSHKAWLGQSQLMVTFSLLTVDK